VISCSAWTFECIDCRLLLLLLLLLLLVVVVVVVVVDNESLHMSHRHRSAVTAFFTHPQIIRILMDAG